MIGHAEFDPPPGSDTHYALLYTPPPVREALVLAEAFRGRIVALPLLASDPVVTVTQLAWWGEELARLAAGEPRHDLTKALAPLAEADPGLHTALRDLVAGTAAGLHGPGYADDAARQEAFDAVHGGLWEYAARRGGSADPAAARRLGVHLEIAYALRDLRRFVRAGAMPLPLDRLNAAGVGVIAAAPAGDLARAVAADLAALKRAITEDLATLTGTERRRLLPLVTLARIALALIAEIERDGCRVWDQRLDLPPLRKLWAAWRSRFIG